MSEWWGRQTLIRLARSRAAPQSFSSTMWWMVSAILPQGAAVSDLVLAERVVEQSGGAPRLAGVEPVEAAAVLLALLGGVGAAVAPNLGEVATACTTAHLLRCRASLRGVVRAARPNVGARIPSCGGHAAFARTGFVGAARHRADASWACVRNLERRSDRPLAEPRDYMRLAAKRHGLTHKLAESCEPSLRNVVQTHAPKDCP